MSKCERCSATIDDDADVCVDCAMQTALFISADEVRRLREIEQTSRALASVQDEQMKAWENNAVDEDSYTDIEDRLEAAHEAWRKAVMG